MSRTKVPHNYQGRRFIFYLSDIRSFAPVLFQSILEANNLNDLISREEDLSDEEECFKGQIEDRYEGW